MTKILFPSIRNFSVVPPVINAINHLSEYNDVAVFSYYGDKDQYNAGIFTLFISAEEYPIEFSQRVKAKIYSHLKLVFFLKKQIHNYDYIWIGVNDYYFLFFILRLLRFRGKIIYQLHELEYDKFRYCRKADFVIVPDDNRAWIVTFLANLKQKPFVLPNIPVYPNNTNDNLPNELSDYKKANPGIKTILYQGYLDYNLRCLYELLQVFTYLDDSIHLFIMPSFNKKSDVVGRLLKDINELKLNHRVKILNSVKAPFHLSTIKHADLGIGLYKATSLNQVYAAPNRLFEFTKFSIPVILPDFPYFNQLSEKYKFAINTADPENPKEIAEKIELVLYPENYQKGRQNAQKFTDEYGNYSLYFDRIWRRIKNS